MRGVVVVLCLAACGRFGFDSTATDGGADAPLPDGRWAKVAQGRGSTCAITVDGQLWCWGFGASGQLGIGTLAATAPPTRVPGAWHDVAVATDHACGIQTDGSLWCWGADDWGQLGDNMAAHAQASPVQISTAQWTQVAVGYEFSCALTDDGTMSCWGRNVEGQLATGNNVQANVPTPLTGTWKSVVAGDSHTCGLAKADSYVWCWGGNGSRQLGDNTSTNRTIPLPVNGMTMYAAIAAGATMTCGTNATHTDCWGDGEVGQLGIGTQDGTGEPTTQPDAPVFTGVALGAKHGCGAAADGIYCWGAGQRGAMAGLGAVAALVPTKISDAHAAQISAAGSTTCFIDTDARLWCTGANGGGQTGQPYGERHDVERADARTDWAAIYAHKSHACGVRADGSTACWGHGLDGQVGDGDFFDRQAPVDVALSAPTQLEIGETSTLALVGDTAFAWGVDPVTLHHTSTPTSLVAAIGVATSDAFRCTIDAAGTAHCDGENGAGELGNGSTGAGTGSTVTGGHTWVRVRASGRFACGVDTLGRMFCWGANDTGQLGDNGTGASSVPQQVSVPVGTQIASFTLGLDFACAIDDSQGLWCWGANDRGQLANGKTNLLEVTPQSLEGTWLAIAAGDEHVCGIRTDHTLWCWGHSDDGQLGTVGVVDASMQQQVGTGGWAAVAAGDRFTCALDQGGQRYCFGTNDRGELGNGYAWLTQFAVVP